MSNAHRHADPEGRLPAGGHPSSPRRLRIEPNFVFDYKDVQTLRYFLTDRGKIVPRRLSGLTAKQQRDLARAIKLARGIALLPYRTARSR